MAQARKTPAKRNTRTTPAREVAVKRSVLRVFLLTVVSAGLYGLYWFYVTRVAVTAELKSDDNAGLQTAGLFVPILNIFIMYWLFRDIDILHRKAGLSGFPAVWYVVGPLILSFIPLINFFAGVASIVIYGLVIKSLNEYWDKSTAGKAVEAKVTTGEIVITVAGLLLIGLIIALGVVAAIFGADSSTIDTTSPIYQY